MLVRQALRRCCGARRWLRSNAASDATDERYVIRSRAPDVHIPHVTIPELVWRKLERWPDHTAVECSATGRKYTYTELRKRSWRLARCLRGLLGLRRGACVAVMLPNVPEYPIALLGALEAGLVVTTVNPIYTPDEIARQLRDSDARAVVTLVELHATAEAATGGALPIVTVRTSREQSVPAGAVSFSELCERDVRDADDMGPGDPEDLAVMPYSSGTTGLPKGVELTHRNIVSNISQACMFDGEIVKETCGAEQDVVSCVLPMFHIYGMSVNTVKMLCLGAKLVTMPRFAPDAYAEMLNAHRPDILFLVPPIVIFMAAHPSVTPEHLRAVRCIVSGAAPLGATDVDRLFARAEREIVTMQGYGMTETSPGITMTFPDMWRECLGSIGVCMPNTELKVASVDLDGGDSGGERLLGPGEKGELLVRGPQVMRGYHGNPAATADVLDEHGWLRTGDMVYYDDRHIVWITDRLKELIKVKAFQVAPAELEALIRDHPAVADAAVIGVPHPVSGEVPKAYVVAKKGVDIDVRQIQEYVARHVASYKKLEGGVTVLDAIPKNPSGKILRKTLKAMYEERRQ